ncbi:ribonuclease H-like domain-containing protein, partial [Bombardia bombarda]
RASAGSGSQPAPKKRKLESGEQKYYAVRAGFKPGVYTSWNICQQQISGFKGAQFKSFLSYADASAFAEGHDPPSGATSDKPIRFYGVGVGRKPGVYTDWSKAQEAIVGWKGPKYKKFETRSQAEAFVRQFTMANTAGASSAAADGNDEDEEREEEEAEDSDDVVEVPPPAKQAKTTATATASKVVEMMVVYTDGSSRGNGKVGAAAGVGVYFGEGDMRNVSEPLDGEVQTNQRAELTGVLKALQILPTDQGVEIRTDSTYAINCATVWYANWERNDWRTPRGAVMNQDLIKAIHAKIEEREARGTRTKLTWVKGHSTDPGNIKADGLAVEGAKK